MATLHITNSDTGTAATPTVTTNGNLTAAASGTTNIPYTPIGFGKPLLVEILTIYTGAFQTKGLFKGNKRDILCVSAAKASETFDATPRAINILQQNVAENAFLQFQATEASTPYIYYKDAVTDNTIEITLELTANAFNENLFGTIGTMMSKAAGLPIFMPAAGKLLAGAQFINLMQSGANDLFAPSPFLSGTVTVQFDTAGMPITTAQSIMVCKDEDQAELSAYQVETVMVDGSARMQLTNSSGVYTGPSPYMIINLDGAAHPELSAWTATAASSAVLSEFYGEDAAASAISDTLQQAMSLYNDYTYFMKATAVAQQLQQGGQPSDPALEAEYKAYEANIQNPAFTSQLPKIS